MRLIKTEDAIGQVLCHDMTQIIKGVFKGPRFRKGHIVTREDVPVLLSMGKENLYVWEVGPDDVHENDAAERLCALCLGPGGQADFALFHLASMSAGTEAQGAEALRRVVLVYVLRPNLPHVQILLAHGQQHRHILRGDDMPLAKTRAFEYPFDDLRHIVAEHLPHRVLGFDQPHSISPSVLSTKPSRIISSM